MSELNGINRSLGAIEAEIRALRKEQADTLAYVRSVSERVKVLELFRNWVLGVTAAVGAIIAWAFK